MAVGRLSGWQRAAQLVEPAADDEHVVSQREEVARQEQAVVGPPKHGKTTPLPNNVHTEAVKGPT